jgi:acetyltransferase
MLPEDRALFLSGLERTSTATLRDRFHTDNFRFSPSRLAYLTEVDQKNHLVIGATIAQDGVELGVGIARCIRSGEGDTAEVAVTVVDDYQHKGVGSLLVAELARFAKTQGINRFTAYVPAERRRLLNRLHGRGFEMIEYHDGVALLGLQLPNQAA